MENNQHILDNYSYLVFLHCELQIVMDRYEEQNHLCHYNDLAQQQVSYPIVAFLEQHQAKQTEPKQQKG